VACDSEPRLPFHDRFLDETPGHGLDCAAPLASNVLMVLGDRLESRLTVPEVDARDRAVPLELPQGAKHRREVSRHTPLGDSLLQRVDRPVVAIPLGQHLYERRTDMARSRHAAGE
jgi:hypothetical protein